MILDCVILYSSVPFLLKSVAIAPKRLKMFGVLDESFLLKTSPFLISSDYEDQQDVMVEKARSSFTLSFCNIICRSHRFNLIYKLISIQCFQHLFHVSSIWCCFVPDFIFHFINKIQYPDMFFNSKTPEMFCQSFLPNHNFHIFTAWGGRLWSYDPWWPSTCWEPWHPAT